MNTIRHPFCKLLQFHYKLLNAPQMRHIVLLHLCKYIYSPEHEILVYLFVFHRVSPFPSPSLLLPLPPPSPLFQPLLSLFLFYLPSPFFFLIHPLLFLCVSPLLPFVSFLLLSLFPFFFLLRVFFPPLLLLAPFSLPLSLLLFFFSLLLFFLFPLRVFFSLLHPPSLYRHLLLLPPFHLRRHAVESKRQLPEFPRRFFL